MDPKEPNDPIDAEFEVVASSHTQLTERPSIDVALPEPEPEPDDPPRPKLTADVLRWRKLVDLRKLVAQDQADVDAKKAALKTANANLEESQGKLLEFIDGEERQPSLPFPPDEGPVEGEVATGPAEGDGDESWRAEPLAAVLKGHCTDKTVEQLAEAGLTTLGELQAYLEQNRLTDVDGIGETKSEKVHVALDHFWQKWRARKDGGQ